MSRAPEVSAMVLALVLICTATLPVAGLDRSGDASHTVDAADSAHAVGTVAAARSQSNNSTHHANPDARSEAGDPLDVQRWLAGRMAEQLSESTVQLSRGEYELARSVLGDEYDSNFERYVDVAGETEAAGGEETAETLDETRDAQETFVSSVERHRNLSEEYREARRNGNTDRARTLARELDRLANRTDRSASTIVANYGSLSNATGTDLSEPSEVVRNVSRNVSDRQAEIRAEAFAETRLTATARSDRASFLDPLRVDARLTTANGSAVADESVLIRIAGRAVRTTTNGSGEFSLIHRPTTLPAGEQSLRLRYVPTNASAYLGSNATVAANVSQVAPTLRVENSSESGGFDDDVAVSGAVRADGVGAADVPVVARLGGERVGRSRTGPNGGFSLDAAIPASVPAGERRVRLAVALTDRALASANETVTVSVRETPSDLTVTGTQQGSSSVDVSGTLASAGGRPVPDQPIELRVNGTAVGTASTGSDGTYATTLDVPPPLLPDEGTARVDVTAVYAADGANLESSRASTAVELSANDGSATGAAAGQRGPLDEAVPSPWRFVLFGGVALVAASLVYAQWRESGVGSEDAETADGAAGATDGDETDSADDSTRVGAGLLDRARSQLTAGETNDAVETAYAAVRRRLGDAVDAEGRRTHWEFYTAYRDAEPTGDEGEELRRLTEAYERAAFTGEPLAADAAESAVEAAATLGASARPGAEE